MRCQAQILQDVRARLKAEHVEEDLSGKIEMILDGGAVDIGVESTILDMTVTPPMILRPGAITKEMLTELIGEVDIDRTLITPDSKVKPKAPGMKYRHYAPKADLKYCGGTDGTCDRCDQPDVCRAYG